MKHVILKVNEYQFTLVKAIVKEVKDSNPSITISPIKQGNLGDDMLASFTVDDENYLKIVHKLDNEGIKLLNPEAKIEKKFPDTVIYGGPIFSNSLPVTGKVTPKSDSPAAVLEASIKNGDYEKVIQYSKDYRIGFEIMKKAKENVEISIKNAIEIAFNNALKSKSNVNNSLQRLINIASDKKLKALPTNDLTKSAGLKAVELCSIYKDYINIMIQICNNNAIPLIVCMKAAIKLSIILGDSDQQEEDLDYTVKYLNIRWLNIVFFTVMAEIPEKERQIFHNLINAVKTRLGADEPTES